MTQDVQPLTWQKRTNLEEHQQFFSKINEIIDNLAPTVDEAEAAIAQATAAIASANDAIATANAASAAASAAATQAQTAANTVAGYDTRLIAVEDESAASASSIVDLQDRMGTAEGNITSLGTRMSAAETKNNQQDTAIGALQTADAQNVKINRINEYAVGLTGNQNNITGTKTFTTPGIFPRKVFIGKSFSNSSTTCVKVMTVTAHSYSALDMLMNVVRQAPVFVKIITGGNVNQLSCRCFSPIASYQDKVIICHNTDAATFDVYLASIANQPVNVAFEAYTRYGSEQYGPGEITVSSDITEIEQSQLSAAYDTVVYSTGY